MLYATACFAANEVRTGAIAGKMMIKNGGALANGLVYFFNDRNGPPPSPDKYWRVPDEITKTDAEGNFKAQLLEGKYYLGATKRVAGQDPGPPQEGDLFLPASSEKGGPKEYLVKKGETTDAGTIAEALPFQRNMIKTSDGITAIEGVITDNKGRPVDKALVFAFLTPAMIGRPLFVSERTGSDGRYLLRVDKGGTYYLKIRDVYGGGVPKVGEIIGSYGEKKATPVTVEFGKILKGINISGISFPGRGPQKRIGE